MENKFKLNWNMAAARKAVTLGSRSHNLYNDEDKKFMLKLRKQGASFSNIAKAAGLNVVTVRTILKKMGAPSINYAVWKQEDTLEALRLLRLGHSMAETARQMSKVYFTFLRHVQPIWIKERKVKGNRG